MNSAHTTPDNTAIDPDQLASAQQMLEALIEKHPDDTTARFKLANVMLAAGHMKDATQQLLKLVDPLPESPMEALQVARQLFLCGETVAARRCLEHPALSQASEPGLLAMLARFRRMLGEIPVALELMQRAVDAGLEGPGESHLYATLLQFCGHADKAEQVLDACLEKWPRFGLAALTRSRLRKQDDATHHVDYLEQQLKALPAEDAEADWLSVRAEFEFALFKELDDLGRREEAWKALESGNAHMRSNNAYDADGEAAITDALLDAAKRLAPIAKAPAKTASSGPMPIFIVGMPRSGTTLLDRMLSSHSKVASAGEIGEFLRQLHHVADVTPGGLDGLLSTLQRADRLDYAELGERYLAQTRWRAGDADFYIDKKPNNILMVPFIRRALPQARILHIVRDPMDVCFSNYKMMFGNVSDYSYGLDSLAHYYTQYARIVAQWHKSLPDAMLNVDYAALTTDPEGTIREVLEHCGLPFEDACLAPEDNASPVATPSSSQVRESVHTRAHEAWRDYEQHLEPLRKALRL